MRKAGAAIPPEFGGEINSALLKKIQGYESDKTRFSFISSMFSNIVTIAFIFGGLLNMYNSWISSKGFSFLISGWLFFMLLMYGGELLSAPFSLYRTFKIENKYGFNTMTLKLWLSDFIKSLLISTIITSVIIFAGLSLIQWSHDYWWLWIWGFFFIFSIFMMYISPYVIEPLFNKFTPVDDELLKDKIVSLTEKAGIRAERILRIDASRRSKHTNAYFTGIGRTKRIVLYDTLLDGMRSEEIIAVLAHEIGHWKKRHLFKTLFAFEMFSFITLYLTYRLSSSDFLLRLFSISPDTIFAKLVIIGFLAGIVSMLFQPIANFISRRHERQADRVSYELTDDKDSMVSGLIKLSRENLSNLYPHPLYASLYYSHPPVLERIRYIKNLN
ncbi:MAG: M48 family metallopeptidase [Nitrospirae bacterium]|nr:M48 family metallopeptidase [Nitrospirota bacterium]